MERKDGPEEEQKQVLTFHLSSEEFGLDISCVREVLLPQKIYPLPQSPEFVEGVIKLRNHAIAVMDMRKKLGIKSDDAGANLKARIIVCKIRKIITGLIVDRVGKIAALPKEAIDPTPEVVKTQFRAGCISGIARIADRVVPLLDLESILTNEEAEKLSKTK